MTILRRSLAALAWAVVLLGLVLPVGAMFVRSFQAQRVTLTNGDVVYAVGDVKTTTRGYDFSIQSAPGEERIPVRLTRAQVTSVDTVWSVRHYDFVFSDARTIGLLANSLWIAIGGATLALLLGLPLAWLFARTRLRGRALLSWIAFVPALLPPFFVALGGARRLQAFLIDGFGLSGGDLQRWNSILVFGLVLYPLALLLVAPALRAVPAGPWEAARLQGGARQAFRLVTRPAVLPAVVAAWLLAFVLALADFAVPDLLGFMLPSGVPSHVFSTEVLLQWKQQGNFGRAVATGAPLVLATLLGVLIALALLRRSPVFSAARGHRTRAPVALRARGTVLAYFFVALLLVLAVGMPLFGIASWAGEGGESSATGTAGSSVATPQAGRRLFAFGDALDRTHGSRGERDRWIKTALTAALVSMLVSVLLVRLALRGARFWRGLVLAVGALALAVPGLVLSVGTKVLWTHLPAPWPDGSIAPSVLVLMGRFLPFALAGSWLALRGIPRAQEDAAALSGADAWVRARTIWGPRAWPGVVAGGFLVLILALREIEAVMLIDARILPLRLYDKIHFSRLADEANLLFLCIGILLVPALLLALLTVFRRPESP